MNGGGWNIPNARDSNQGDNSSDCEDDEWESKENERAKLMEDSVALHTIASQVGTDCRFKARDQLWRAQNVVGAPNEQDNMWRCHCGELDRCFKGSY